MLFCGKIISSGSTLWLDLDERPRDGCEHGRPLTLKASVSVNSADLQYFASQIQSAPARKVLAHDLLAHDFPAHDFLAHKLWSAQSSASASW